MRSSGFSTTAQPPARWADEDVSSRWSAFSGRCSLRSSASFTTGYWLADRASLGALTGGLTHLALTVRCCGKSSILKSVTLHLASHVLRQFCAPGLPEHNGWCFWLCAGTPYAGILLRKSTPLTVLEAL